MKTSPKKSPLKKASTQKKAPIKKGASDSKAKAPNKPALAAAVTSVPKKVAKKSAPVKKVSAPKTETQTSAKEGVKMLGILHLVGNIFSGGLLGIILVVLYLVIRRDELSQLEKETCYEIINFNLSFIVYTFISACAMFILVGFLLLPIVIVTAIVLMIMGFLRHLVGENYRYPLIIRFIS